MSTVNTSAVNTEDVLRSAAARWQCIDPLLPDPSASADPGCGAELAVSAAGGRAAAVGWCRHPRLEPEAAELAWGAADQFWLTARVAATQRSLVSGPRWMSCYPAGMRIWKRSRRRPVLIPRRRSGGRAGTSAECAHCCAAVFSR